MLPSEIPDLQLVSEVKQNNSSFAVTEVINRFSGCYMDICNSYTYVPRFEMDELICNKNTNIYKYVLDYRADKGMKISTYISQRIKWECMSKIVDHIEPETITENVAVTENEPSFDNKEIISKALEGLNNEKFSKIVKLRYLGSEIMTWQDIGKKIGCSHEYARIVFNDNLPRFKYFIEKEMRIS